MTAPPQPLDEIVHRRDDVINWWLENDKPGIAQPWFHMEERMIHRYFSESPFFDWTSKNGFIFRQAEMNQQQYELVHSGRPFENAFTKRPGLEYVIVGEPQPVAGPGVERGQKSNVWVLRKQDRLNEQGPEATREDPYPVTETRGTYYILNENVYQAPSVADVVENRMLSAVMRLEKMFDKVEGLPTFTPTTGHTYLPPASSKTATAGSTQGSPSRSREGSVAPGTAMDTQSLRSGSTAPDSQAGGTNTSNDILHTRLLIDSLKQTAAYSDEYMDENPIVGEPGNFKFTSSTAAVKKRKADEEAAALAAQKAKEQKENSSRAASPKAVKAPTPPSVFTEARATAKTDKERKEEKKKRRKSRPNAGGSTTTPTTPKSATSALAPGSAG